MLTLVVNTIQFIVLIIQSAFLFATFTGEILFNIIVLCSTAVLSGFQNFVLILQIIYEDNAYIVTDEIPNFVNSVFRVISEEITTIQNICFKIDTAFTQICWSLRAVFTIIVEVLNLLKKTLIFIGDTFWFILTFIPVQLPLLLKQLSDSILQCLINLSISTYLESLLGITSAIIIVRVYVHYKDLIHSTVRNIYWALARKVLYRYYAIQNYFTDPETRMITRMVPAEQLEVANRAVLEDDGANPLCVICQEHQKCVLTLPCRHVCLCRECCVRLYRYQRTCPICRTFICYTVTIYL